MKTDDVYFDGKHYYKMNLRETKKDDGSVVFSVDQELLDVKKMFLPVNPTDVMELAIWILDGAENELRSEQKALKEWGKSTWLSEVRESMVEDLRGSLVQAKKLLEHDNDIVEIYNVLESGRFIHKSTEGIAIEHEPAEVKAENISKMKKLLDSIRLK